MGTPDTTSQCQSVPVSARMPHICGPYSNLPNCRYFDSRKQEGTAPTTTWVPIPIHKELPTNDWTVKKTTGNSLASPSSHGSHSSHPPSSHRSPQVTNIPVKLSSPALIMKAKETSQDDLFPQKKKSEFY